jgi:hypothetical protein
MLDLILATEQISTEIHRDELPLVSEDVHHPCLNISLFCNLHLMNSFSSRNNLSKYNFRKADYIGLYAALSDVDWTHILTITDVEHVITYFYNALFELLDKYVPKLNPVFKTAQYPIWYTSSMITKIKEKNKFWNRYRKTKITYHLDNMKKLRREISGVHLVFW